MTTGKEEHSSLGATCAKTSASVVASEYALSVKLGVTYTKQKSIFRVWAPTKEQVILRLFPSAEGEACRMIEMTNQDGVYTAQVEGDWDGYFYTFFADGIEVVDPYSVSVSLNGRRSAVVDLSSTNPAGFRQDAYVSTKPKDAILYELHVGDYSFHTHSGAKNAGKYLGLVEESSYQGINTGLAHLKELGITHVHLMPIAENATVDEHPARFGADDNYNWGYDPHLYNVPEGAYAIDPYDPKARIRELKTAIQKLHEAGIGVVLDVVYNHTFRTKDSVFNLLVPDYYYRKVNGDFANGTGVGNEIASEAPMMRKFILESLLYWQKEYAIDGFRFDLMALTDRDTIRMAEQALRRVNPNVILYGEPWAASDSPLPMIRQTRWGTQNGEGFALFNAVFRDALCGGVDSAERGFLQGNANDKQATETGLLGSIHDEKGHNGGVKNPYHTINYFNAHDNLILEDKLTVSLNGAEHQEAMTKLAFSMLLTAQGIPFFHAGNSFRRSKKGNKNSYCAPYSVNAIDWEKKKQHLSLFQYVQQLIALRKAYPVFRLETGDEVRERVKIIPIEQSSVLGVAYRLGDKRSKDYLVSLFHDGWWDFNLDVTGIFDTLHAERVSVQRIFDHWGSVSGNRVQISRSDHLHLPLAPISMAMFRVHVLY